MSLPPRALPDLRRHSWVGACLESEDTDNRHQGKKHPASHRSSAPAPCPPGSRPPPLRRDGLMAVVHGFQTYLSASLPPPALLTDQSQPRNQSAVLFKMQCITYRPSAENSPVTHHFSQSGSPNPHGDLEGHRSSLCPGSGSQRRARTLPRGWGRVPPHPTPALLPSTHFLRFRPGELVCAAHLKTWNSLQLGTGDGRAVCRSDMLRNTSLFIKDFLVCVYLKPNIWMENAKARPHIWVFFPCECSPAECRPSGGCCYFILYPRVKVQLL